MIQWPPKDPSDVLDYSLDWSEFTQAEGDTISTSTWSAKPSGLTLGADMISSSITSVWLSGGTAQGKYTLTNTITTAGGRTLERSGRIIVHEL